MVKKPTQEPLVPGLVTFARNFPYRKVSFEVILPLTKGVAALAAAALIKTKVKVCIFLLIITLDVSFPQNAH